MWKFVTRGIRESLERRVCRTNVYSQSSQDGTENSNDQSKCIKNERICITPSCSAFYHGYCGSANHLGAKDKESHQKYDAKYTWTDAVGWSSILAVGYVVCQSLCIRRKLFEIDNSHLDKWRSKLITNPKNQATRILNHLLLPQPKYILPVSKEVNQRDDRDKLLIDNATSVEKPYGPLTAEEAFDEAAKEFSHTHNDIMGNLELNFGSKAIEEERYKDAFEHFNTGAEFSSAGSIFNLALCYELGLGISKNYAKAVQYYKEAADKGHADAMYNLGVFHAQGKGGLKTNLDTARQLFTGAAEKGHSQAIKALQLEKSFKKRSNLEHKTKYTMQAKAMNSSTNLEHKTKYTMQAKAMNSSLDTNRAVAQLASFNSSLKSSYGHRIDFNQYLEGYNEHLESQTHTDIFLDMLGVHERSAIPLIFVGESGP